MNQKGQPLTAADLTALEARWIDQATAGLALLGRVDSAEGGSIVGRNGNGRYEGIVIPYRWPGSAEIREYRLRRDHPEMERASDGSLKPKEKYISPPGRHGMLYFGPRAQPEQLATSVLPVVLVEGEFKTLALERLAYHEAQEPRFLPVGIGGVWNWRGVIGKANASDGTRVDVKGPIPDLDRLNWAGRLVVIAFDADVKSKPAVQAALTQLTRELAGRGARVLHLRWPDTVAPEHKGIDDYLAAHGPDAALAMIESAGHASEAEAGPKIRSIADVPLLSSLSSDPPSFVFEGMFAAQTVNMITGDAGLGKSTFALALAAAVANGSMLAGIQAARCPVLYLDRENPLSVIQERRARLGIEDGQFFRVWGGWLPEEPPAPGSPMVVEWVKQCHPKPTIFVDSLAAFMRDAENEAEAARRFMDQLRMLANLGCCIVILHHSGKGESTKEYRGSSDLKASIDVGYVLTRSGSSDRLDLLKLRTFKARLDVLPELAFRYADGAFHPGHGGTIVTVQDRLVNLLLANPGLTISQFEGVAMKAGIARNRIRQFVEDGMTSGSIAFDIGTKNAKFLRWAGAEK